MGVTPDAPLTGQEWDELLDLVVRLAPSASDLAEAGSFLAQAAIRRGEQAEGEASRSPWSR